MPIPSLLQTSTFLGPDGNPSKLLMKPNQKVTSQPSVPLTSASNEIFGDAECNLQRRPTALSSTSKAGEPVAVGQHPPEAQTHAQAGESVDRLDREPGRGGRRRPERPRQPARPNHNLELLRKERAFQREHPDSVSSKQPPLRFDGADLTKIREVFRLSEEDFSIGDRIALGFFLKQWQRSKYRRSQYGYRERMALILSAKSSCAPKHMAYCTPKRNCNHRLCPSCNFLRKVGPTQTEFGTALSRFPDLKFVALVPSFSGNPETAGLHRARSCLPNGKTKDYVNTLTYQGRPVITLPHADQDPVKVEILYGLFHEYATLLKKARLIEGAFFCNEMLIKFTPQPYGGMNVRSNCLPHSNFLVATKQKPGSAWAQKCWELWVALYESKGLLNYPYPDLFVGLPMPSDQKVMTWLGYCTKSPRIEKWYAEGIREGCDRSDLNLEFSQTVFSAVQMIAGYLRGPVKTGVFHPESPSYVGKRLPPRAVMRSLKKKMAAGEDLTNEEWDAFLMLEFDPAFKRLIRFQERRQRIKFNPRLMVIERAVSPAPLPASQPRVAGNARENSRRRRKSATNVTRRKAAPKLLINDQSSSIPDRMLRAFFRSELPQAPPVIHQFLIVAFRIGLTEEAELDHWLDRLRKRVARAKILSVRRPGDQLRALAKTSPVEALNINYVLSAFTQQARIEHRRPV